VVNAPLFALEHVRFARTDGRIVLAGIDFELLPGERVALVGGNGAGKTTLLHLMVGLHRPSAGTIVAFGRKRIVEADFHEVRRRAGLLFQDSDDQLFCPTVIDDVAFGPLNLGYSRAQAHAIAETTLQSLSLAGFAERITHKLSGGEKRLVSLATVLAMQPDVLLLDEPTSGLDAAANECLVAHLQALPQAMVIVSHDRALITALASRVVILRDGRLQAARLHAHPHAHVHMHPHLHPSAPALEEHPADDAHDILHDLA
jgi:cobalt/nickel transport system ATP-binding protein